MGVAPYVKAAFFSVVSLTVIFGIVMLALQNCQAVLWLRIKEKISLALSVVGMILFIAALQPYAAVFLLVLLIIKTSVLFLYSMLCSGESQYFR